MKKVTQTLYLQSLCHSQKYSNKKYQNKKYSKCGEVFNRKSLREFIKDKYW